MGRVPPSRTQHPLIDDPGAQTDNSSFTAVELVDATHSCGDGVRATVEECDDGNTLGLVSARAQSKGV